jgi:hypothetical protein
MVRQGLIENLPIKIELKRKLQELQRTIFCFQFLNISKKVLGRRINAGNETTMKD